jgi:hypothetical protein
VPSPQQIETDGGAGLDVAASSMCGQDNFHRRNPALSDFHPVTRTAGPA